MTWWTKSIASCKKNYEYTTIIKISDYKSLIINIKRNNGVTNIIFRKNGNKVFKFISNYDFQINKWFEDNKKINMRKIKMRMEKS